MNFHTIPGVRHKVSRIFNNNDCDISLLYEGNEEAENIIDTLFYNMVYVISDSFRMYPWADTSKSYGYMDVIRDLCDMNIRGEQILHAYDYCDGDITLFVKYIYERNPEMIEYVNSMSVKNDPDAFYVQKAVAHNGNDGGKMLILHNEFKSYGHTPCRMHIPYELREIREYTTHYDGVKILIDNGFLPVYDRSVDACYSTVIMYAPRTGALMVTRAMENRFFHSNCCYIVMCKRYDDNMPSSLWDDSDRYLEHMSRDGLHMHYIYADTVYGLIYMYKSISTYGTCVKDINMLSSMHPTCIDHMGREFFRMPVPQACDYFHKLTFDSSLLSRALSERSFTVFIYPQDFEHRLHSCIDCLLLHETVNYMTNVGKCLYGPVLDNIYAETVNRIELFSDVFLACICIGTSFRILETPVDEIDKFYGAARHWLMKFGYFYESLEEYRDCFYGNDTYIDKIIGAIDINELSSVNL